MTVDLAERIRSYYEAAADPISAGEILAPTIRSAAVRPIQPRIAPARPWPAVAGFVAALLAIGGVALLLRGGVVSQTDVASDAPATNAATAAPISVEDLVWARVPHDESAFGGDDFQEMTSVAVGGPGLVAVGHGRSPYDTDAAVWTSADGVRWTRAPHDESVFGGDDSQVMWSVAVGGPGLVAIGGERSGVHSVAAVWTSADGVGWTRVPHDESVFGGDDFGDFQMMKSVAVGGPGLVAVGSERSGDQTVAAVWTSADGIDWTRAPHDESVFAGNQGMTSVTVGGPGLVAVGGGSGDAAVWTSADGVDWSRVPYDESVFGGDDFQVMLSVAVGGPGLVAVGGEGSEDDWDAAVWTSVDGVGWARVPHDESVFGGDGSQLMRSVAAGGPGLVAVGSERSGDHSVAAVWTSVDGVAWTRVPHDESVFAGNQGMTSVAVGGPGLVAVGGGSGVGADAAVWYWTPDR
jgi:hypothetical protein